MEYLESLMNVLTITFESICYTLLFSQDSNEKWLLGCWMLSAIHSPKSQKLPKLWERLREIIVVFLQLPPWVLRCVRKTTVFPDSLTKGRRGAEGSSDCLPSPTSLKRSFPICYQLLCFSNYGSYLTVCAVSLERSPRTLYTLYIGPCLFSLLKHVLTMSWPDLSPAGAGWQALDAAFSLHLSAPVPLLVRADAKKAGSVKACLQHFYKGRVLSVPFTTVSSASRAVPSTS